MSLPGRFVLSDAEFDPIKPRPEEDDPERELLEAMLRAAAEWERGHDSPAVRQAIVDGLRAYLGSRATDQLAAEGPADGSGLVASVEPVLALFLGRDAAAELVSHVLNQAFVRA